MEKRNIGGIEVGIKKKAIKHMYIRVSPSNGVNVTAPTHMTDGCIDQFVLGKIDWIKKQKKRFSAQFQQEPPQYVSGEKHYLWGKEYVLEVKANGLRNQVSLCGEKIILQVRHRSTVAERAKVMTEWYRSQIKLAIPEMLAKCEKLVGVKAKEWRVKNMRTRWGSCNITAKRIWLNLQLVKKSPECLEYVIVHELVHLLERDHNHIFQGHLERIYPHGFPELS